MGLLVLGFASSASASPGCAGPRCRESSPRSRPSGLPSLTPPRLRRCALRLPWDCARRATVDSLNWNRNDLTLSSPQDVKDYLRLAIGLLEHEVFCVVFLDSQHRVLDLPAVVLAHNHPSGAAEPSRADEILAQTLKTALQLVDVRVLDHLVVTTNAVVSFAERALI